MTNRPSTRFLSVDHAVAIHGLHIQDTGGSDGIRSVELLDSAIHQPTVQFGGTFLHKDIFEMASAYLFHVVKNHPFVDGNKRVGLGLALTFLELNGAGIEEPSSRLEESVLAVIDGKLGKAGLADFFRRFPRLEAAEISGPID